MFSLGSHGQVDFEQAVLARWQHCRIFVYDHTLTPKQRDAVLAVNGELPESTLGRSKLLMTALSCVMHPGSCSAAPPAVCVLLHTLDLHEDLRIDRTPHLQSRLRSRPLPQRSMPDLNPP